MYKDTYTAEQLGTQIITATQTLTQGIWSYTKRERVAAINAWIVAASNIYNMPVPEFEFIEGTEGIQGYRNTGGGITLKLKDVFGEPTGVKIIMYNKFSLTTLLHEFRHAMQLGKGLSEEEIRHITDDLQNDLEEDAREWSCSLYFNADPTRYMKAVQIGKLRFA